MTLALVACGPMYILRRWPLPVLAAAVAAAAVVIASGAAPLPLAVLLGLATYLVSSRLTKRISVLATLAAALAIGGALLYAELTQTGRAAGSAGSRRLHAARSRVVRGRCRGGTAAIPGRASLSRQGVSRLRRPSAPANRSARSGYASPSELHDVVAHTLAVITIQAGVGRRLMTRRPEEASQCPGVDRGDRPNRPRGAADGARPAPRGGGRPRRSSRPRHGSSI